ncbi:MAG: carbamoyltransferase HypF [Candidatus Coatesbacteria bacterium]
MIRYRIAVHGAVQGVGFRPFVYRLARELDLAGWVVNTPQGVAIEAEGRDAGLEEFLGRLRRDAPARALVLGLEAWRLDPKGRSGFEVRESDARGPRTAFVMPDLAVCDDCLREMRDPKDRRYRYPFVNCTNCGPRFSVILDLPYDRARTTMRAFDLCPACRAEYGNPADRRFHAEPVACPACGPALAYWDALGTVLATGEEALRRCVETIQAGGIVAVKGLGGFHLMADARRDPVVRELRRRKHREEKPLAVMAPSLEAAAKWCEVSAAEAALLRSPEAPIVLLKARMGTDVSSAVAPGNPTLGVMLPYTPLHHLLLEAVGSPVVATSGNRSDEPICTDETEALRRLAGIADGFLVHDRPIARHGDDSVVRVILGRPLVLRRARGYAPLPVGLAASSPPVIAVGAHLKNAIAVTSGPNVFVSQHIGDLETPQALEAFGRVLEDFQRLYAVTPAAVVHDLHPGYASTAWAFQRGLPAIAVQHHRAHVLACMAENDLEAPCLGVAWDGTGWGEDGTVWGGEFLGIEPGGLVRRVAHLRTFALPGGEAAVREPRRAALGVLHELFGDAVFAMDHLHPVREFGPADRVLLRGMLERGINSPRTSSAGRLFDAVASIAGSRQVTRFEGQAAMELEWAAASAAPIDAPRRDYPFPVNEQAGILVADWSPLVRAILDDVAGSVPLPAIAAGFHAALARVIAEVAVRLKAPRVVLSGGCFQNALLLEAAVGALRRAGIRAYWHQRVPPNDGCIALGQALAASIASTPAAVASAAPSASADARV